MRLSTLSQAVRGPSIALLLAGCANVPGAYDPVTMNARLVQGPPIEDIVTAFDAGLGCLRGKINRNIVFAVGQVTDNTGKESYSDGGSGKLVTQGAGDMVQSALFRAGVTVVNRSAANISVVEATWGIRDIKSQVPVNFYISGSINSLDFIPGGGYSVSVAGFGPRKRQSRILIGLDLSMVDAFTGRVVASIPLQKQIFMAEKGFTGTQFFGDTLVSMDAGGMEREAMHFALRQMISLATFELLGQVMNPGAYGSCQRLVPGGQGAILHGGTANRNAMAEAAAATAPGLRFPVPPPEAVAPPPPAQGQPAPAAPPALLDPGLQQPAAPQTTPQKPGKPEGAPQADASAEKAAALGREATRAATKAISVAKASGKAATKDERVNLAVEAMRLANYALKVLQHAAQLGFGGDDGEVAAVVVQEAINAAKLAGVEAAAAEGAPAPTQSSQAAPEPSPPAAPKAPATPPKVAVAPLPAPAPAKPAPAPAQAPAPAPAAKAAPAPVPAAPAPGPRLGASEPTPDFNALLWRSGSATGLSTGSVIPAIPRPIR